MKRSRQDFDVALAEMAKEAAIARAEGAANEEWKSDALQAVAKLAKRQTTLTADDVWGELSTASAATTAEPRALGGIMKLASKMGLIEATEGFVLSSRVACHRRPVRIWRSLAWREAS